MMMGEARATILTAAGGSTATQPNDSRPTAGDKTLILSDNKHFKVLLACSLSFRCTVGGHSLLFYSRISQSYTRCKVHVLLLQISLSLSLFFLSWLMETVMLR